MMNQHQYHVGDRVQLLVDHPCDNMVLRAGDTGTVVSVPKCIDRIGVCWEVTQDKTHLHACDDNCVMGYGWYVGLDQVAPEEEILIEVDDLI